MKNIRARFQDAVLVGRWIFFFDNFLQSLCKMDINNMQLEIIKEYSIRKRIAVRKIFIYENTIYLVGRYRSQGIVGYSIESKAFYEYKCEKVDKNGNQAWTPVLYGSTLTFMPRCADSEIVSFDMVTKKFTFHAAISDMDEKLKSLEITYPMSNGEICSFAGRDGAEVLTYNLCSRQINILNNKSGEKIRSCLSDENGLWIITECGNVIYEEENTHRCVAQGICSESAWMLSGEQYMCISTQQKNKVILLDKRRFDVREIELPFDDLDLHMKKNGSNFVNCFETDLFLYLVPYNANNLYRISKKNFRAEKVLLKINEGTANALIKDVIVENSVFGFRDYIELIK